jgi:hypothetical protein
LPQFTWEHRYYSGKKNKLVITLYSLANNIQKTLRTFQDVNANKYLWDTTFGPVCIFSFIIWEHEILNLPVS